jgi:hypothetical protein
MRRNRRRNNTCAGAGELSGDEGYALRVLVPVFPREPKLCGNLSIE